MADACASPLLPTVRTFAPPRRRGIGRSLERHGPTRRPAEPHRPRPAQCPRSSGNILTVGDEPSKGNIDIFFTRWYCRGEDRSAWQREYFRDYYAEDEHLPRMRRLPDGKIVPVAELFSEQERKTSRMYNEALVRFEGRKGLIARLHEPLSTRIVLGIADPVDASGWSSSRIDMIGRVLPHLRQYVRVRTALADAGALGTSLAELLGNARAGVIQLDRSGRIVEANENALALLRRDDGLSYRDGELHAAVPEADATLQELLAQALPRFGEQGASGTMMVRRSSPLPRFALHVTPVSHRKADDRSRDLAALVVVVDPVTRATAASGLVEAALGLTPTETEIAVLLAEGRTTRQVAAATGRGYSTVRTHLKHIFHKLGVSRQFEVTQLVLALSSLPVPRD